MRALLRWLLAKELDGHSASGFDVLVATYLLIRTPYAEDGVYFGSLNARNVCDWFTRNWDVAPIEERGVTEAYGLTTVFDKARDKRLEVPRSSEAMVAFLREHMYSETEHEVGEHLVHVDTDDGEVRIEYWLFDDDLLSQGGWIDELPAPRSFEPNADWYEMYGEESLGQCREAYSELFAEVSA